jgi:hypothetical protein
LRLSNPPGATRFFPKQKADGQQILKGIARTKLKKLRGDLLDRREVEFVVGNAIATLRPHLLRLPLLIASELRELSHDQLHAIRMRVERAVDSFLEEASESLGKAIDPRAAIAELEAEDNVGQDSAEVTRGKEDALARKRVIANEKRRAKRRKASQMIHFPSKAARDRYELSLLREENTRLSLETAKLRAVQGHRARLGRPERFQLVEGRLQALFAPAGRQDTSGLKRRFCIGFLQLCPCAQS